MSLIYHLFNVVSLVFYYVLLKIYIQSKISDNTQCFVLFEYLFNKTMNFGKAFFIISGLVIIIVSPIGTMITELETRCPSFGDACNPFYNQPCCGQHLVCIKSKFTNQQHECLCEVDYEWINNKCLQISDRFCVNDDDCRDRKYTKCSEDSKCVCESNYAKIDFSTCRPAIGSFCVRDIECFPDNSVCRNEMCHCADGFISLSNENCSPTFLELSCKSGEEECQEAEFLLCDQEKCYCPVNHVMVNGRNCLPLLNEMCSERKPCAVNNSDCVNGRCKCNPNFAALSNNRCLVMLKKPCRTNYDCINVPFAECSKNKTCVCKSNYVLSENGACLPPVVGICTSNSDCTSKNSYCHFNRCRCTRNFVGHIINGVFECKKIRLGSSCETDHDCSTIKNSKCSHDKICVCHENNYALDDGIVCVPGIGGHCLEDVDCALANFRCFNNFCQCQQGYVSVEDNQCVLKSSAVFCNIGIQCGEHWHSDCSFDNTCFCKSNNTLVNQATCSPILGGACWRNDQCTVKNSICISFRCQCKLPAFKAVAINMCL